ncbi:MAG: hypothetical protein AAGE80_15630 [Pseudomonadota bacterium]
MTNLSLTACRERGTDTAARSAQLAKQLRAKEMRRFFAWVFGSARTA